MVEDNDVLTPEEVAAKLRLHIQTVYELLRSGEIPAYKTGRHWKIDKADFEAYKIKQKQKKSSN